MDNPEKQATLVHKTQDDDKKSKQTISSVAFLLAATRIFLSYLKYFLFLSEKTMFGMFLPPHML
jgi:hypothetical protein